VRNSLERPDFRNVITTIFAMVYLTFFSSPFFVPNSFLDAPESGSHQPMILSAEPSLLTVAIVLPYSLLILGAWVFLVRDLIKQVSLFFRRKPK
jgi:hypothetical protein